MKLIKLIDSYINTDETTLMQYIFMYAPVEWLTVPEQITLNNQYIMGYSGDKYLSPLAIRYYEYAERPEIALSKVAEMIANTYVDRWKRIYNALHEQYKPLENYSMVELRTPDISTQTVNNLTENLTMSKNTTEKTTFNQNTNVSGKVTNNVRAFNDTYNEIEIGSADSNTDTTQSKLDNENEVTYGGSNTDVKTNTGSVVEHTSGTERLTRSGNIGITTSQQMLISEVDLRVKYDLFKIMFEDIDSMLTLSIY